MEVFSGTFVVDVHEHEHDSFDQLFPATHQHQNLQEVSWREECSLQAESFTLQGI